MKIDRLMTDYLLKLPPKPLAHSEIGNCKVVDCFRAGFIIAEKNMLTSKCVFYKLKLVTAFNKAIVYAVNL